MTTTTTESEHMMMPECSKAIEVSPAVCSLFYTSLSQLVYLSPEISARYGGELFTIPD